MVCLEKFPNLRIKYLVLFIFLFFLMIKYDNVTANEFAQQPTLSIPTVTGTPIGTIAKVHADQEQINLRTGPGVNYPKAGVLFANQEVPALGRTAGGNWVQVAYPGIEGGVAWVFSPLVSLSGELLIVESPATPTPRVTPTINSTLASQFIIDIPPTRLPTFTPPPVLIIPTFVEEENITGTGGVPVGFLIVSLGVFGLFGMIISFIRER